MIKMTCFQLNLVQYFEPNIVNNSTKLIGSLMMLFGSLTSNAFEQDAPLSGHDRIVEKQWRHGRHGC